MTAALRIITLHYVRDSETTRFPGIPAESPDSFRRRIDQMLVGHRPFDPRDLVPWVRGEVELHQPSVLFTFDDGLREHLDVAAPILEDAGLRGLFFASAAPLLRPDRLLGVHKVQHLMGSGIDHAELHAAVVRRLADLHCCDPSLPTVDEYRTRYEIASRFDPAPTRFVKRILQDGLDEPHRTALLDELFASMVLVPESEIAAQLYLRTQDLEELAARGHVVGGHGFDHRRFTELDDDELDADIRASRDMVQRVHPGRHWTHAYCYGSNDEHSRERLAAAGCAAAFSVTPGVADRREPMALQRFDINDIPACLAGTGLAGDPDAGRTPVRS